MKLSEWASVAEITSAFAVVISLVYVGLQVSQNTIAVTQSTHQAMVDYNREQSALLRHRRHAARGRHARGGRRCLAHPG